MSFISRMDSQQFTRLTNYMEQSPSSEAKSHSASQETPPTFTKPLGSLPCSEQPATGP
jgi:hypothetical protein